MMYAYGSLLNFLHASVSKDTSSRRVAKFFVQNDYIFGICIYMLYKIWQSRRVDTVSVPVPKIPKLKTQDMMLHQLKKYDGTDDVGRVCIAVNGKIFDVTRGKKFYGPGGPYSAFAGRDATRALATFCVNDVKDTYDDLSDLSSSQMDSVREWEIQINEKYDYVGRFLKPGEEPNEYTDEEESNTPVKDTTEKKNE